MNEHQWNYLVELLEFQKDLLVEIRDRLPPVQEGCDDHKA